jgi:phenylalanyl-tRNA synthetase alpha chain
VEEIGDRVRAAIPDEIDSVESVRILSETAGSALPQSARARMGLADGQKNVLLRVVLRHPGKTLTAVEANVLRDRVYGAVHEGGVGEWAGTGIGTV